MTAGSGVNLERGCRAVARGGGNGEGEKEMREGGGIDEVKPKARPFHGGPFYSGSEPGLLCAQPRWHEEDGPRAAHHAQTMRKPGANQVQTPWRGPPPAHCPRVARRPPLTATSTGSTPARSIADAEAPSEVSQIALRIDFLEQVRPL
jgi:hypothetical protein